MNCHDFNERFAAYLEPGFYGCEIDDTEILDYLAAEFDKGIAVNPDFQYAQIKLKFGTSRVYTNSDKSDELERHIDTILTSRKSKMYTDAIKFFGVTRDDVAFYVSSAHESVISPNDPDWGHLGGRTVLSMVEWLAYHNKMEVRREE